MAFANANSMRANAVPFEAFFRKTQLKDVAHNPAKNFLGHVSNARVKNARISHQFKLRKVYKILHFSPK